MSAKTVKKLTKEYLELEYIQNQKSIPQLAEENQTYPNFIRRKMLKFGLKIRDSSDAQKNALEKNRAQHPTEGQTRPDDVKFKIGNQQIKNYKELPDEEKDRRAEVSKTNWKKKSKLEIKDMRKKAIDALQISAKKGSKLELYLYEGLLKTGYKVLFHEQFLVKERLQLDIYIPQMKVAIEVDGLSHFSPIWGTKAFSRVQRADRTKSGLILNLGMIMIRIKATSNSNTFLQKVLDALLLKLEEIKKEFPKRENRNILIDVE